MSYRGKIDSKDETYSERSLTFARRYKTFPFEDIKRTRHRQLFFAPDKSEPVTKNLTAENVRRVVINVEFIIFRLPA
jgi:hypothetical protein